jgi:flagellar protein FlgJ
MTGAQGISVSASLPVPHPAKSGGTLSSASDQKVRDMAREFEATFLSMLLKQMRETLDPEAGLFPGDSGDVQGGLFDLYMSRHLADAGGVGMAAALVRQIRPTTAPVTTTNADRTAVSPTPGPTG